MADAAKQGEPEPGQIIAGGPTLTKPVNVRDKATNRANPTPTERSEARADRHIAELQGHKGWFLTEFRVARDVEIPQLRGEIRRLMKQHSSLENSLTALRTSYDWAISFNWFSSALIIVGGDSVSIAGFLPAPKTPGEVGIQKITATAGFVGQLIGTFVQAFLSYKGTKALLKSGEDASMSPSSPPGPNPTDR